MKYLITVILLSILSCLLPLAAEEYPPPEKDEIPVYELENRAQELDGKVIETEISNILNYSLKGDYYRAYIDVIASEVPGRNWMQATLYFPKNEDVTEYLEHKRKDIGKAGRDTIYVYVSASGPRKLTVVGFRYKRSREEYKW